jgi:hypothetical protein
MDNVAPTNHDQMTLDTPFIHHLCVWLPRVGVYKIVFQTLNNRGILGRFSSPELYYVTVSGSIYISVESTRLDSVTEVLP